MSISSISASPPVQPATIVTQQPTPPIVNNDDSDDASAAQPAAQAPLPPGQGTRFDQLV